MQQKNLGQHYTAEYCQTRCTSLRDQYSREKRNIKDDYKSGNSCPKRRTFPFFTQLSFLDNFIKRRRTFSNIEKEIHLSLWKIYQKQSLVRRTIIILTNQNMDSQILMTLRKKIVHLRIYLLILKIQKIVTKKKAILDLKNVKLMNRKVLMIHLLMSVMQLLIILKTQKKIISKQKISKQLIIHLLIIFAYIYKIFQNPKNQQGKKCYLKPL